MHQDPLQDKLLSKTHKIKYTYIYCIIERCNLTHISIGFTFKTAYYGEIDVINFKFDSEYYSDPILG